MGQFFILRSRVQRVQQFGLLTHIQIQKALWRKLEPLFSSNKKLYTSKEVKENALESEGKSCRPETITRGALGFSVLRFWLFFRSVFRFLLEKTSVFRFWWSLRFANFSFFSIWFSVFVKNTSAFSVLVPDVVFGFSYFVLFWVPVSVRFEQHLI